MADTFGGVLNDLFNIPDYGLVYRYSVLVNATKGKSGSELFLALAESFSQEFSSVIFPQVTVKTRTIPQLGPTDEKVITSTSYGDLILKRGTVRENSFWQWVESTVKSIDSGEARDAWRSVTINALDRSDFPMATWQGLCRPRVYHVTSLNANRQEVMLETVQLSVKSFKRV